VRCADARNPEPMESPDEGWPTDDQAFLDGDPPHTKCGSYVEAHVSLGRRFVEISRDNCFRRQPVSPFKESFRKREVYPIRRYLRAP